MSTAPIPQGKYVPATRFGNLVFTAGMTPRRDGQLIQTGRISSDAPIEACRAAVCQAAENALNAVRAKTLAHERIEAIASLTVYINAEDGLTQHSKVADFASEYLWEALGDQGIGSRAAVGVASLPGNAPVEIQLIAVIGQ